jgi:hypothetical protein
MARHDSPDRMEIKSNADNRTEQTVSPLEATASAARIEARLRRSLARTGPIQITRVNI